MSTPITMKIIGHIKLHSRLKRKITAIRERTDPAIKEPITPEENWLLCFWKVFQADPKLAIAGINKNKAHQFCRFSKIGIFLYI
jgi:hypothetical protein